jgi:hypothetical protein
VNAVVAGHVEKGQRSAKRLGRVLTHLPTELRARSLLRNFGRPSGTELQIPEAAGYVRFDANAMPGVAGILKRLRALGEAWVGEKDRYADQKHMPLKLNRPHELLDHPEFLDLALHEDILRAVSVYLGQVPRLHSVELWWSPPNQTVKGSQLFHYDHRDSRQPKLFVNLNDVSEESGPLHFLSVDQADRFNSRVGYSQERITDEQVFSVVNPSDVKTTVGSAGTGFFVDTARCLHYGSRGNKVGRLVFMANFMRANCVDPGRGDLPLDYVREEIIRTRYSNDPVRRFALAATR